MSFDKNRWISGRLTIIVIAALMLAFVVVPAMGAPLKCSSYCTGWKKVAVPGGVPIITQGIVYSFTHEGVKYGLWLEQTRYCSGSRYEKSCWAREWCTTTRKCEKTGNPVVMTKAASGTTCTAWEVTDFEMRIL